MTDTTDILRFFDRQGNRLTLLEWGALFEDLSYRVLAQDTVKLPGPSTIEVITIWTGVIDDIVEERPFSTAYKLNGGQYSTVERYDTEADALAGHRAVVDRITSPVRSP